MTTGRTQMVPTGSVVVEKSYLDQLKEQNAALCDEVERLTSVMEELDAITDQETDPGQEVIEEAVTLEQAEGEV